MKKNKDAGKLNLQDLLNLFKPSRHDDDGGGGGNQFVDGARVEQDMDEVMRGLVDRKGSRKPSERKEDPVFGRRW